MRQLSLDELLAIVQEARTARLYQGVQAYVELFYDTAKAKAVKISATSRYNDENYSQDGNIHVYNANGVEIPFDFTKPFFQHHPVPPQKQRDYLNDNFERWCLGDEVRKLIEVELGKALDLDFDLRSDECALDEFEYILVLDTPPEIPKVFVEE